MNFTKYTAALALLAVTSVYAGPEDATTTQDVKEQLPALTLETYKTAISECKGSATEEAFNKCMTGMNVPAHQVVAFADKDKELTEDEFTALMALKPAEEATKTSLMTYALWGAGVFGVVALGGGAYYFATRKSADEL